MRYRNTTREQMVKEFIKVKNDPHVSFYCLLCVLLFFFNHFCKQQMNLNLNSMSMNKFAFSKNLFSQKLCSLHAWTVGWFPLDSQRHMSAICLLVGNLHELVHSCQSLENRINFDSFVFPFKCEMLEIWCRTRNTSKMSILAVSQLHWSWDALWIIFVI